MKPPSEKICTGLMVRLGSVWRRNHNDGVTMVVPGGSDGAGIRPEAEKARIAQRT